MDTREFDVNGFHLTLTRCIGDTLFKDAKGNEGKCLSGDFLTVDKTICLPATLVDAMAAQADEKYTVERDGKTYVVETGPGEKFDGMKVIGEDGKPVEGKSLTEVEPAKMPSSDDLVTDPESGEVRLKTKEEFEADAKAKELAVSAPANVMNSIAGQAAREVAALAAETAANAEAHLEGMVVPGSDVPPSSGGAGTATTPPPPSGQQLDSLGFPVP